MTIYAYAERPLGDLFEPFTTDTLPAVYADEYAAEPDELVRQARLRLYGEIHSLSRMPTTLWKTLKTEVSTWRPK